ncbi:MAG: carboxypeptidase M32 [Thermoplasmata archaeon]
MKAYDDLLNISSELRNIERNLSLLAWDERTYMPPEAIPARSGMRSVLYKYHHELLTSDKLKRCIKELNISKNLEQLNSSQKANLREMTRAFERKYNVPNKLIQKIAKAATEAQSVWKSAREKSDFNMFLPHLEKNVELRKEFAGYIEYENEPYDALLDEFDPGSTAKWIEKVFGPMKKKLSHIVDKIASTDIVPGQGVFDGKEFPVKSQMSVCEKLAKNIGFDFNKGRLDSSVHPFTVGMDYDVRITNRYNPKNISSIYSLLHESGHGMYEQNIGPDLLGTPIGQYISMGFHESQSRTWENFVGRSRPFMDHLYPMITKEFPSMKENSPEDIYQAVNRVEPSLIRVEADEVTYNLHIALRYDIELGLFRDEIEPNETEVVWQNKMDEYLGISPPTAAEGVLQDVHWSTGQFGYFPSYTLGNLYAAQLFNTIRNDISTLDDSISKGDFQPLGEWLKSNIYCHGKRYLAPEMLERLTGEPLTEKHLIDYIKEKYSPIYGISL